MIAIYTTYRGPNGIECVHQFWRNFMEHIHERDQLPDRVWKRINEEIARYGGSFAGNNCFVFERDSDATRFLLRWS